MSIRLMVASGCFTGFFPKAPGSVASFVFASAHFLSKPPLYASLLVLLLLLMLALWSVPFSEQRYGHDASLITIDEWIGQTIALLAIPFSLALYASAFALFRLFDIWKPYPINRMQSYPGVWGVVADDVLAGAFANLILQTFIRTHIVL